MRRLLLLILLLTASALLLPTEPAPAASAIRGHFEPVLADTDVSLYGIRRLSGDRLFMCGADGTVVRSEDGGNTWEAEQVREGVSLRVMSWADDRRCVIAGRTRTKNVLLLSSDGGITFREASLEIPFRVHGFAFLDSRRGLLVAGSKEEKDGAWRLTTDGGSSWQERDSVAYRIPARTLNATTAVGEGTLFAVGSHVEIGLVGEAAKSLLYRKRRGAVLTSTDAGQTWEVRDAGNASGTDLYAVEFFDERVGWVGGEQGFAAVTTDGGLTWKPVATGTEERINAIDAVDADTAFFAGENGLALSTSDGGATFSKLVTDTTADLLDLTFTSASRGLVIGRRGTVLTFERDW